EDAYLSDDLRRRHARVVRELAGSAVESILGLEELVGEIAGAFPCNIDPVAAKAGIERILAGDSALPWRQASDDWITDTVREAIGGTLAEKAREIIRTKLLSRPD